MRMRYALAILAVVVLADLVIMLRAPSLWFLPLAAVGWYLADLMSGVVHMVMDYRPSRAGVGLDRLYFYEGSRESDEYIALRCSVFAGLGPIERITYDFKNHHPRPDALGRRSMETQIGSTAAFMTLPFALVTNAAMVLTGAPTVLLALLTSFLLGTTFAQYFHGTLHRVQISWPVAAMRASRLLMQPRDHERHHKSLSCDFSTISGWSNPLLNRIFAALRKRGYLHEDGLIPH